MFYKTCSLLSWPNDKMIKYFKKDELILTISYLVEKRSNIHLTSKENQMILAKSQ